MFTNIPYERAKQELRQYIVRCVFRTSDGRDREIWATRNAQQIAKNYKSGDPSQNDNPQFEQKHGVINVFDLQKKDFRKINLKTVLNGQWQVLPLNTSVPSIESNPTAFKKEPTPEEKRAELEAVMASRGLFELRKHSLDDLFADGDVETTFDDPEKDPFVVDLDDIF